MSKGSKQLDFGLLEPSFRHQPEEFKEQLREHREIVIAAMRRIAEYVGFEQLAKILGRPRASISQALHPDPKRRNGHHIYAHEIPVFIALAPNDELANALTASAEPEFSEEEKLEAFIEASSAYLGSEIHKGLITKARRIMLSNRRKGAKGQ